MNELPNFVLENVISAVWYMQDIKDEKEKKRISDMISVYIESYAKP